jgi:signal transduction histidine kinase/CheY-like chemotaxis protein
MVNSTDRTESYDDELTLNYSILIVDDSEVDRATYRRYLEAVQNLNCNIFDCESAEDALEICTRDCPDVILLDYLLPGTNGLELLQKLTKKLGKLPIIIMLTGQGSEAVAVEAMKRGARDYLIKGKLTPQSLINAVVNGLTEKILRMQLDQQRQQRELLTSITLKISHAVELSQILQEVVEGTRQLLDCDRALVYRFNSDLSGKIIAESVLLEWSAALDRRLEDNCFQGEQSVNLEKYLQGHKLAIADIESANLTACHVQMLQQFQVKSVLVIPILCRDISPASELILWGLLIAHHCKTVHKWQADELNLLDVLSLQIAIAIQQAELVSDLQATVAKQQAIEQQLRDRVMEIEQINLLLSQSTHLLEERNQELDDFSHIASHDLQAPLRGISNLVEWLVQDLGGQLPLENQHQLELIQSRVLQMSMLINALLQYARVGRENIDFMPVNITQLLTEVVEMQTPPSEFQILFSPSLPTIETQSLLLKQVFSNLIGNAVKYHNRTNGKVEILMEDRESLWQFTVADDGPGIAPENHKKIFGVFQTVADRDDLKGMGIGLAIVKKLVEGRGGSIWVKSELGKGSAFSFTWPKTP